jgi:anti-sigma-K factor RskA
MEGGTGSRGATRALLQVMDPEHDAPGYWNRFRGAVMERAAFELARRRASARESVAAVLSGWSRSLIPVAAAAAVAAVFLIGSEVRHAADAAPPLALEDVLASEVEDGVLQTVVNGQAPASPVAFMALVEGNTP